MIVVTPSRRCSALDLVAQAQAHLRVERGERLVEQQQATATAPARGPAPRAAAGRPRAAPDTCRLVAAQTDQLEQLVDAPGDLRRAACARLEAVGDVLAHGEVREQRVGLEDDAVVALAGRQRRRRRGRACRRGRRSGARARRSIRSSVVLPQPDGAEEADELALGRRSSEMSRRATNAPNFLAMPSRATAGGRPPAVSAVTSGIAWPIRRGSGHGSSPTSRSRWDTRPCSRPWAAPRAPGSRAPPPPRSTSSTAPWPRR